MSDLLSALRIVCLSDTHTLHWEVVVPDGDVLVFAGDMCNAGTSIEEVAHFGRWLRTLPHRHKVVIAGNHDWPFERDNAAARKALGVGIHYLQDEEVECDGLRLYGSPWQPAFCGWAFNLPRGEPLARKWANIPDGLDVLVTHSPPRGTLDVGGLLPTPLGCDDLAAAVLRARPRLHVFGHIHEGAGVRQHEWGTSVNASVVNEKYQVMRPARVMCSLDIASSITESR